MRIVFLKREHRKPSGGHKHIRHIVARLIELGVSTEIRLVEGSPASDCTFGIDLPVAAGLGTLAGDLRHEDVVVFPEKDVTRYLGLTAGWRCRRAVLLQNEFYALETAGCGYREAGIDLVIVTTPAQRMFAERRLGMAADRIGIVPYLVARAPFGLGANVGAPEWGVVYMPRKLPEIAAIVRDRVRAIDPTLKWIAVDGVDEAHVARAFQDTAFFLSTQDREGFGLPALEAMSCGCVVAGFRGTGTSPHPYATPQNGYWVPDRSVAGAIGQLATALRDWRSQSPRIAAVRAAGLTTASRHSHFAFNAGVTAMLELITCATVG